MKIGDPCLYPLTAMNPPEIVMRTSHKEPVLEQSTPTISPRLRTSFAILGGTLALVATLTGCTGTAKPAPLPSGFPTSIPLISNQVKEADTMGKAWTATVTVGSEADQKAALTKLTDNGFVVIGQSGAKAGSTSYSLADQTYSVRLGFGKNDAGYTVSYTIARRSK